MSRKTFISAGSNTTVRSTGTTLYGVHVTGASGGTVLLVDNANLGTTPNFNVVTQTGLFSVIGPLANAGPHDLNYRGVRLENGLTIAATSNARITVFTD